MGMLGRVCAAATCATMVGAVQPSLAVHDVRADDPLAVCNDGSSPVYYAMPPSASSVADHWQIILPGAGNGQSMPWCFPPAEENWTHDFGNCYWGTVQAKAPPAQTIALPCGADSCIYSTNCTTNPDFCNFGKIVIPQCTFDNWMGDTDRVVPGTSPAVTLHYRGQRMLKATLTQVAKDLLSSKSTAVVFASDGGGFMLYSMADRIGSWLQEAAGVPPSNYAAVPIEGFWPRGSSGYYSGDVLAQAIIGKNIPSNQVPGGNSYKFMNFANAANPECMAEVGDWTCLLPQVAGKYIKSRFFAVEQLYGTWGSFCIVNSEFVSDPDYHGYFLHCDKGGTAKKSMHACVEYGWECSPVQMTALVMPYQKFVLDTFSAMPFLQKAGNGAFMHSCHVGDEDEMGAFYNTIKVNGRSTQEALGEWWRAGISAPAKFDKPCLWNPNASAVFHNNCNPTCPNIPYLASNAVIV